MKTAIYILGSIALFFALFGFLALILLPVKRSQPPSGADLTRPQTRNNHGHSTK